MSVFRRLGKSVEKTKRAFTDGSDTDFVCQSCDQPVEKDYEYCPHCGEPTVERVE